MPTDVARGAGEGDRRETVLVCLIVQKMSQQAEAKTTLNGAFALGAH
ncbi:MAG: hypothetical protein AAGI88_18110 [Pseudomonadota bacterium]